jgi:hypothetical protein
MKTQTMKTLCSWKLTLLASCLLAVLFATGCASTSVTTNQVVFEPIPRPDQIWVYDFAATDADIPAESALAGQSSDRVAPQTPEQIAEGRKVGAEIAAELVGQIHAMGMPAERATAETKPRINDLIFRGYLISINEGSEAKRIAIGFGSGASEMKTAMEAFQVTATGLRKIGSGTTDAGGSKTPGAGLGAATFLATANPAGLIISSGMKVYGEESGSSKIEGRVKATVKEIAVVLKQRFQEQGWIN